MRQRYKVGGTKLGAGFVRLILIPEEIVKESDKLDIMGIMGNPDGLMNKMRADALRASFPESFCIPYSVWEKKQYKIGDIIYVSLEREGTK